MPANSFNGAVSHRRTLSAKSLTRINTSSLTGRVQSHTKLSALGKKRTTEIELTGDSVVGGNDSDIENNMTFHQYCTTCDKQILVPNSLLYCSESCRRKDSLSTSPSLELKLALRPSRSPTSPTLTMATEHNPFDTTVDEDQARLGPSLVSKSLPVYDFKPPELHNHKPDLDPTEWKPNSIAATVPSNPVSAGGPLPFVIPNLLPEEEVHEAEYRTASETTVQSTSSTETTTETTATVTDNTRPDLGPRRESAAFNYLAQFHRSASSFLSLANNSSKRRTPSLHSRANSITRSGSGTPAMSLDHSSRNSSSGYLSSSSAVGSEYNANTGVDEVAEEAPDEGLCFGKQTIENVQAVGLSSPVKGNRRSVAEGSLKSLLARA